MAYENGNCPILDVGLHGLYKCRWFIYISYIYIYIAFHILLIDVF